MQNLCTIHDIRRIYLTILVVQLIGISVLVVIFYRFSIVFYFLFLHCMYCILRLVKITPKMA